MLCCFALNVLSTSLGEFSLNSLLQCYISLLLKKPCQPNNVILKLLLKTFLIYTLLMYFESGLDRLYQLKQNELWSLQSS